MLSRLKKMYLQEQFNPKFLGIFINPFYFARRGLYLNIKELSSRLNGKLLDIGCGTKPYKKLFNVDEYIGLEIDDGGERQHNYADVLYDGKVFPFDDKVFDSILSNEVFEHVFNPSEFLKEINRVTKLGGGVIMSVPFVWDEHEQPYDYARYSSFGLKHILSQNGFEVIEHKRSNNGIEVIFQLLNAYLYKKTVTNKSFINLLIVFLLNAPINILGIVFSSILPKNDDLYLDNVVFAIKVRDV